MDKAERDGNTPTARLRMSRLLGLWLILTATFGLASCNPLTHGKEKELEFKILWTCPLHATKNAYLPLEHEGILYLPQTGGLIAVRLADGSEIWRSIGTTSPASELLLIGDYLLFAAYSFKEPDSTALRLDLWLANRHSGELLGKNSLLEPDFVATADWQTYYFQHNWMVHYQNRVYLPLYFLPSPGRFAYLGIYSFEFDPLRFSLSDTLEPIQLRVFYPLNPRQSGRAKPVIEGSTMYLGIGGHGWRGAKPPGIPMEDGYYLQEDVRIAAVDLAKTADNILWQNSPAYAGFVSGRAPLLSTADRLYYIDSSGLAVLQKNNGVMIYENPLSGMDFPVLEDDVLYAPRVDGRMTVIRASDGTLLWEDVSGIHNRESNPVLYGDRLYIVDSDGLLVFNRADGRYIGRQSSLGTPGDRIPGYMPYLGNILYIPQTDRLLAVQLGSER